MRLALERNYADLAMTRLMACVRNARALAHGERKGVVTVGTGCSGMDLVIGVLNLLSEFLQSRWGVAVKFKHVFSRDQKDVARGVHPAALGP